MNDRELLVHASRLYYELGETQSAVAERLGVTRPQVSRLLKRARAEGVVEIRIIDDAAADSPAADVLRRRYGLDAVHLAPSVSGPEDLARRMVGRLAAEKNLSLVFSAFDAMHQARPATRLVLVGDGPERAGWQTKRPDAIFCGTQVGEALAAHYASGDVFLFPSLTETWGNVTIEAMAST